MKKILEILFKLSVVVLALFTAAVFLFAMIDDGYLSAEEREKTVEVWIRDMEVQENDNLTAENLAEYCKSKNASLNGFCSGYLLGFTEGHNLSSSIFYCENGNIRDAEQIEKIFSNFMEAHPEHWKKPRAPILGKALMDTFPCSAP